MGSTAHLKVPDVLTGLSSAEDAVLMWFERLHVGLLCFEKYVLYPAIVLSALTNDGFALSHRKKLGIQ